MTTQTSVPPAAPSEPPRVAEAGADLRTAWTDYWSRVRGGDIGALPAGLAIVALVLVFGTLRHDTFLTLFNFANLLDQSSEVIVISMGLVFVLLLGEIDLSAGFAAGTSAAIMGVTLTQHGWPWWLSIVMCLITGASIGLVIGLLVARLRIPSFVVTLAFFLGLQGVMLIVIGEGGTIPIRDSTILAIMNNNMSVALGWTLWVVLMGGYGLVTFQARRSRQNSGLPVESFVVWTVRWVVLVMLTGVPTYMLNLERSLHPQNVSIKGIPYVVPLVLVLLIGLTFLLIRTSTGRHIYAVGGNAEAARRAGINVPGIRMLCFITCSTLAAVAGILFASRDNSISPSTGGSTTLLYAVGAAVIGGTSLFGGRGKVRDAILGGLVVTIIDNGMNLLNQPAGRVYIVTGLVLLVAASVDAISRRRAASSGRA